MLIAETNPRNHAAPIIIRARLELCPLEQRKDRSYLYAAVTRPGDHSLLLSIATVRWNSIAISLLPWLGPTRCMARRMLLPAGCFGGRFWEFQARVPFRGPGDKNRSAGLTNFVVDDLPLAFIDLCKSSFAISGLGMEDAPWCVSVRKCFGVVC